MFTHVYDIDSIKPYNLGSVRMFKEIEYEVLTNPQFWRDLVPSLSVTDENDLGEHSQVRLCGEGFSRERLIHDGYQDFDEIVSLDVISKLRGGINELHLHNWLPVFCFLYDEYWLLLASIRDLVVQALGFEAKMMPDFWAWYVDPRKEEAGWRPHREKMYNTLLPDGMPKCMTAWIALTEADTLSGCLYFIPAHKDDNYGKADGRPPTLDLQNVRAVPVKAGSILLFNEGVYHWGGSSSKYAKGPRLSLACEFQRGDISPYNKPLLELASLPSFDVRWQLVGKQVLQYKHMYHYPSGMLDLANRMVGTVD